MNISRGNPLWLLHLNLHPVIRMACFILLVASLAITSKMIFIVTPPLIILFRTYCSFSSILSLLKRLRWLFLSLLIFNLWFNSPTFTWIPNFTDLLLASERITVLIIIVLAAHLLITTTSTQEIIAALQWWLIPLNKIGFSTIRLAVRLALVLDTIQVVERLYTNIPTPTSKNPIRRISDKVAGLFAQVLMQAETAPLRTLEIPQLQSPPWWQWGYPVFILGISYVLTHP